MFCKLWAYAKYYFLKSNIKYDGMKEPWRFLTALLVVSPWLFSIMIDPKWETNATVLGMSWMLVVILYRLMWHAWVKVKLGGDRNG